jgi:outer membrane protein W
MKFGRILVLSLATLLFAVPAVYAQDDMGDLTTKRPKKKQTVEEENNDPARSGVLLGIGATYAIDNFDSVGMSNDGSGGFNVHLGYRYNKYTATEVQVERYQQFDGHDDGIDVGEVNGWALGVNQRAYLLSGRYQPFVLLGINYMDMETTDSGAINRTSGENGPALRFGTGLDVYATSKFVVTADISYMLGLGGVEDYDVVAFSLGFLFRP